ncbi:putative ATP-dependent helicase [Gordonia namibiensis NBRC 108229]|uniref:Putative ATP-dependent helicase n=1 Tax=Gordonia namibiensis NBRC 108229 TaxID=1208314 RepID=K6X2A5_9ACTN|nr:DUF3427 domain-containing protein [Gordonia namibiensis]GAB98507.1 putative ATP-dependent helicase [Gordonia namibiensis NBRC 108229]
MNPIESPFVDIPRSEWIASNRSAFAIWDAYPVSPGHALVISRREIEDWWVATAEEKADLLGLVDEVRDVILAQHGPVDGFNVGFNAGRAAGQTINHLHIHVIPRRQGDVPDPRGGVRHVIPERGNYLAPTESADGGLVPASPVLIDGRAKYLLPELVAHLRNSSLDRIDIVVSFIKMSGLGLLTGALGDALDRSAVVRILTTDYLGLTEPLALARLHDLADDYPGQLAVKIFQDSETSFHPKAYLFYSSAAGAGEAAFVGSSNLSRSGLSGGIEWSLHVGSIEDLKRGFEDLWSDHRSIPLTNQLIADYRPAPQHVPAVIEVVDSPEPVPSPRPIQLEALQALARTRDEGFRAGMVTLATGLGKTWLAAFDVARFGAPRVLFLAHREEILIQSRDVFRRLMPTASMGLYFSGHDDYRADVVFASVQTLSRNLELFDSQEFDYIVVDEFHHAAATTYRAVLDHFTPQFLLGLTATPDRMDGADLLALCADNHVYDCDLVDGIRRSELVPFQYWGVPDPVDFEPIPWRNGRFDPEALEAAFATQDRAQAALDEWRSRKGQRTLAFCASKHHADFMADFFADRGVRCASVHSGPSSAPRNETIDALRDGELEVVFAVDLFNEGLDVPTIDTVLMLRPTESSIIFLQQLGRGLRISEGKDALTVIDFIGNHRSFLLKPRTILSLAKRTAPTTLQVLQAMEDGDFDLPPGCSVDYELVVVDMLKSLTRTTASDAVEEYCRSYQEDEGLRPTAAQTFRAGHDPATVSSRPGGWFGFLDTLGLLGPRQEAVYSSHADVLRAIQVEDITKCYKLIAMRALLHDGRFCTGDSVANNASTSRQLLLADPRLAREVPQSQFPDLQHAPEQQWRSYWLSWPLSRLTGADGSSSRRDHLFRLDAERLIPNFNIAPDHRDVFESMAAELIEYRLAKYLLKQDAVTKRRWPCRVALVDGLPSVLLDRRQYADLPAGDVKLVAEGATYEAVFSSVAIDAIRAGGNEDFAPRLLKRWFGPTAGYPGHVHTVELVQEDDQLTLRAKRADDGGRVELPLFGSFTTAIGAGLASGSGGTIGSSIAVRERTDIDLSSGNQFVCFADAGALDPSGGVLAGEPLLFEWGSAGSPTELIGETILAEVEHGGQSKRQLATVRKIDSNLVLESADGSRQITTGADILQAARLVTELSESDINPLADRIGDQLKSFDVPELYGETYNPGNWRSGHVSLARHAVLFVTLEKRSDSIQYVEHFEGPDLFVWSSQNSTKPEGKKGREILEAPATGKSIELWMRRKPSDPFTYLGRVIPLGHEGSQPMTVKYRLLTPLSGELRRRLNFDEHNRT